MYNRWIIIFLAGTGFLLSAFNNQVLVDNYFSSVSEMDYHFENSSSNLGVKLPALSHFAGENIPLDKATVNARFKKELNYMIKYRVNTQILINRAYYWMPYIESILKEQGIPEDLKYLVAVESMFSNVASVKGAAGFWQIMPVTARHFGLELNREVDERYHLEKATIAAAKYIRIAHRKFGGYSEALASYNYGMTAYARALRYQNKSNFYDLKLNSETSRYFFKILAAKEIIEHANEYGFDVPKPSDKPKMKTVKVDYTIKNLSRWAKIHGSNYNELKKYNPWLRRNTLTVVKNKYYINLPDRSRISSPSSNTIAAID